MPLQPVSPPGCTNQNTPIPLHLFLSQHHHRLLLFIHPFLSHHRITRPHNQHHLIFFTALPQPNTHSCTSLFCSFYFTLLLPTLISQHHTSTPYPTLSPHDILTHPNPHHHYVILLLTPRPTTLFTHLQCIKLI